MKERIYLDFNASTRMAPEVVAAMMPYLEESFGNPSSLHWAGLGARDAVEKARSQVADLISCDATEVIFTSGGTEANNHVIKGLYFAQRAIGKPFHVIISSTEHPAVIEPCRFLETFGATVTHLTVDASGLVDPDDVRKAICPATSLISIMHANNETGTIQSLSEIATIAHEHGIFFHTDAAQSIGKISVEIDLLGVDFLSIAGHKLYGPKGVGALYVREGIAIEPLLHGANHEAGRRAGTENVLEVVGLGAACGLAEKWVDNGSITEMRDYFWNRLQEEFGERVVLHGHVTQRLPNTLNVSFVGQIGSELLAKMPFLAASTGAACHAGDIHISPVLAAMGVTAEVGIGAIRFSLGRTTTRDELDQVVNALIKTIRRGAHYDEDDRQSHI